jgi:hypothetical protein
MGHLGGEREFRYFTLCARPMIDVYMLVKEKVLAFDDQSRRIEGVSFCELDEGIFPEMIELVGVEGSGFLAKLEDLALFEDTTDTALVSDVRDIEMYLQEEGEGVSEEIREAMERKRRHLLFRGLFPFDFLNLDFCDRYYGHPPDVLRINSTIERLLEWQRQPGRKSDGSEFAVQRFVLAITCRVDRGLTAETRTRLSGLAANNARDHRHYREALEARAVGDLRQWATQDPLDFFMSIWPKEVAQMARTKGWDIAILHHAFYDRRSDQEVDYDMVCLVAEFTTTDLCTTYVTTAARSLDLASRSEIQRVADASRVGKSLLSDLRAIVSLRNEQAQHFSRELLPEPLSELNRLRREGVPL